MSSGLDARKLSAPEVENLHIKSKAGGKKKKGGGQLGGGIYLAHGALGMPTVK